MKKLFTLLLLISSFGTISMAQTIEMGKSLYQQGDYDRAIFVLERVQGDEAQLFLGKSHFAERNYLKAIGLLRNLASSNNLEWSHDAIYTTALSHFQLDNFSNALETFRELGTSTPSSSITRDANVMYNSIIGYLTEKQRFDVFKSVNSDEIRMDILEFSMGKVDYHTANTLLALYESNVVTPNQLKLNQFKTLLADSVSYWQRYNPNYLRKAPKGISYNLGVVLPEFEFDSPEYEIPQHLYYGIQLAVEQFNGENTDQKAFITYRSTTTGDFDTKSIISDFVFNEDVDVIIGPLFSQIAKDFSEQAELYEIPMLLPLANADSLDLYNNFVFQLNPSFETQGKVMAQYAVNTLGYDTLGIIAEKRSLGAPAARAFRHEAQRIGGYVEYYFEENFEELGYDIRDYTQFFTTDTLDSVAMVKAIYAPFTGTIAQTLIQSLLTDLEAMRSEVAILGSEEWREINLEERRLDSTDVYFSRSFDVDTSTIQAGEFISEFRIRFQTTPNQFAFIGYDAANLILEQLQLVKNPLLLREALRNVQRYRGLSIDIDFNGSHVNHEIDVLKYIRNEELEVVEPDSASQAQFRRR